MVLVVVACSGRATAEPDFDLWLSATDGQLTPLTEGSGIDHRPAWSPDGARIAFGRDGDILVIDAQGSDPTNLTDTDSDERFPSWSPDGSQMVFTRDGQLVVMDVESGETRQLTNDEMRHNYPDWSPDGETIAFVAGTEEPGPGAIYQVYVISVDGGEPEALTDMEELLVAPRWSPDGSRIAFFSHGDPFMLWVMSSDGSETTEVAQGGFMSWSPDGRLLVFDREVAEGDVDLFVLELNEMVERPLVEEPGLQTTPDWSPHGSRIVFSSAQP